MYRFGAAGSRTPLPGIRKMSWSALLLLPFAPFCDAQIPNPLFTSQLTYSPQVLTFGTVLAGSGDSSTATVTLQSGAATNEDDNNYIDLNSTTILGPQAAAFQITNNQCIQSPDGQGGFGGPLNTCTIQVTFTPTTAGPASAVLEVQSDTGTLFNNPPIYVFLQGSGVSANNGAALRLSPRDVTFGAVNVGLIGTMSVSVENTGSVAVSIGATTITGPDQTSFTITANTCKTLRPGARCTVNLKFSPASFGAAAATLRVSGTGGTNATATLEGAGLAGGPIVSITPNALAVTGMTGQKSYDYYALSVANAGYAPLLISNFQLAGPNASDFTVYPLDCSPLAPLGGYCVVTVTFTPQAAGIRTATLSIVDNAPGSPQVVPLSGEAFTSDPNKSLEVVSYGQGSQGYFGDVNFGTLNAGQNSGTGLGVSLSALQGPVTVSKVALTGPNAGDFLVGSPSCLGTLGACQVPLSFQPSGTGLRLATLAVTDNASGSPQKMTLAGYGNPTGSDVVVGMQQPGAPVPSDFGLVKLGTSSAPVGYGVIYYGSGETITSVAITGPNAADFALSLCSTGNCGSPYTVVFTPRATGPRVAALQVTYTGGVGTVAGVPLTGFGEGGPGYLVVTNASEGGQIIALPASNVSSTSNLTANLLNIGTGPVTVTSATVTGANAADFQIAPCSPSELDPGVSCNLGINFTPSASGVRLGLLEITGNASNAPQTVSLIGVGERPGPPAPAIQPSSDTLDFGIQTVNGPVTTEYLTLRAPIPVTGLQIGGPDAHYFSIAYNNCDPGAIYSCFVGVQFSPTKVGPFTATLNVESSSWPGPPVILSGVGQASSSVISVSSSKLNFGSVNLHSLTTQKLAITNIGDTPLTVGRLSFGGTDYQDFSVLASDCTQPLLPGENCELTVAFRPSANGTRTATLQIGDTAPGGPLTVQLTGMSQLIPHYVTASAHSMNFDAPALGQATTQNLNVFNSGADPVVFSSPSITQPGVTKSDFSVTANICHTVAAGGSCLITVSFAPLASGIRLAALTVASDAANGPLVVSLVGQSGTAMPALTANVQTLDFGVVGRGTASPLQTVAVTTAIALPSIVFDPPTIAGPNASDFSIVDACTGSQPGASAFCGVGVIFTPSTTGAETATLTIGSSSSAASLTIALTGTGATPSKMLVANPDPLLFSNSNPDWPGYFPYQPLTLSNTGSLPVEFKSFQVTGPNAGNVSLPWGNVQYSNFGYYYANPNLCGEILYPGSSCTVPVIFGLPAGATSGSANLVITDDAAGSPQTIPLIASYTQY